MPSSDGMWVVSSSGDMSAIDLKDQSEEDDGTAVPHRSMISAPAGAKSNFIPGECSDIEPGACLSTGQIRKRW